MKIETQCGHCLGKGYVMTETPLSKWEPPSCHPELENLEALVHDAIKAESDHTRLCLINPRAKESYDRQLAETLAKLESDAKEAMNPYA